MKRLYQTVLAVRNIFCSRNFAICALYMAMAAFVLFLFDSTNAIYIRDGENISLEITLMDEPEDILSEYGIMTRVGLHCAPSAHKSIGTFPTGTIRFSLSSM